MKEEITVAGGGQTFWRGVGSQGLSEGGIAGAGFLKRQRKHVLNVLPRSWARRSYACLMIEKE